MMNLFKPSDMGEELGLFSAKMIYHTDELNSNECNALKLSLSRVLNLMNKDVLKVFKTFIKDEAFWETACNTTITRSPGLSPHLKTLFENIITIRR